MTENELQLPLPHCLAAETSTQAPTFTKDELARRIRHFNGKIVREMLAIGAALRMVKSTMSHGDWLPYLILCGISVRTAQNYMRAAELAARNAMVAHLPAGIIYELAYRKVTDDQLKTVIAKAKSQIQALTPSSIKDVLGDGGRANRRSEHIDVEKFQPLYEILISAGLADDEILTAVEPAVGSSFNAFIAYIKTQATTSQAPAKPTPVLTYDGKHGDES